MCISNVMCSGNFFILYANYLSGLIGDIIAVCKTFWYVKWQALVAFTPFAFVLAAFGAFVFLNGGIVLGNSFK